MSYLGTITDLETAAPGEEPWMLLMVEWRDGAGQTGSRLQQSGQELRQGRMLEAGADAETMRNAAYWLSPHGLLSLTPSGPV